MPPAGTVRLELALDPDLVLDEVVLARVREQLRAVAREAFLAGFGDAVEEFFTEQDGPR